MRRFTLSLLMVALISVAVVLLLPGTALAATCDTNPYSAEVFSNKALAMDTTTNMTVAVQSGSWVFRNGTIRSRIEEDLNGHKLQVGLIKDNHGWYTYIEYDGVFQIKDSATPGVNYGVWISHWGGAGSTSWNANDGNGSTNWVFNEGSSAAPFWSYGVKNKQDTSGTCNTGTFFNTRITSFDLTNTNNWLLSPGGFFYVRSLSYDGTYSAFTAGS